jgi:hypothetical protein
MPKRKAAKRELINTGTDKLDPDSTNGDIWLMDLARSIASRFTFDPADDTLPVFIERARFQS